MAAIISNNCWGAGYYQQKGIQYNTPTIGLWFYPSDFMRLLFEFRQKIQMPLQFIDSHQFLGVDYPIGLLGGEDIKVMFMHYKSEEEARSKWESRVARLPVDDDQLFIKICDRDGFTQDHLGEFVKVPFRNKMAIVKAGAFRPVPGLRMVEIETGGAFVPDGVSVWNQMRADPETDPHLWIEN